MGLSSFIFANDTEVLSGLATEVPELCEDL